MSQSLALTISITVEALVVGLLMMRVHASVKTILWPMFAIIGATLLTHPFAWLLNKSLAALLTFPSRAFIIESLVIIAEMLLLSFMLALSTRKTFVLAAIANLASFSFGLLMIG